MGACAGTPVKNTKKSSVNNSKVVGQRSQLNKTPSNISNAISKNGNKESLLVHDQKPKVQISNYDNLKNQIQNKSYGALQNLQETFKNPISRQFNNASANIKDSYDSFGNKINDNINQSGRSINDYQNGLKDSYNNLQNKIISESKDTFNPQRFQAQYVAPAISGAIDNFRSPKDAPYPQKQDLKTKFNWALQTADQNFTLQHEAVFVPPIDLKIS